MGEFVNLPRMNRVNDLSLISLSFLGLFGVFVWCVCVGKQMIAKNSPKHLLGLFQNIFVGEQDGLSE